MEFRFHLVETISPAKLVTTPRDRRRAKAAKAGIAAAKKWTPLMLAVLRGLPTERVISELKRTDSVDEIDVKGRTALFFAVADPTSSTRVLRALLDAGADPTLGSQSYTADVSQSYRYASPLMQALHDVDLHRAELLWERVPPEARRLDRFFRHPTLEAGPSWNVLNFFVLRDKYFASVWVANELGDDYVVACAGPDVPTKDNALDSALMRNQLGVADFLIAALHRRGLTSFELVFVPRPDEVVDPSREGSTLVHRLAASNRADSLHYLLFRGLVSPTQVDRPKSDGFTPLHSAVCACSNECVLILLSASASRTSLAIVHPEKPPMTPYRFARKKLKHGHESLWPGLLRNLKPTKEAV